MDSVNPVLAQKIGLDAGDGADVSAAASVSPAGQLRRAMARAADRSVGLSATVLGTIDDEVDLEALIEGGPQDWIVLGLREGGKAGLTGLVLLDPGLRSALVEMQTMGSLLPKAESPRPVTRVDGLMTIPFTSMFLAELADAGFKTGGFDLDQYEIGPIENLRTAGLVMAQGRYRTWRITIQIGGSELEVEILIAILPNHTSQSPDSSENGSQWANALRGALAEAPVELDAVLGSLQLPIAKVESFEVGQILQLAGTTVGSVTLRGAGGESAATARLGQVAGKRAVRIEEATVELQPDALPFADAPATSYEGPDKIPAGPAGAETPETSM